MRFGKTLGKAVYAPWKDKYIDYAKLKSLLRDDNSEDDNETWTEDDENRFCEEIFNVQLEKVAQFQQETFDSLKQRVADTFDKLKELAPPADDGESQKSPAPGEISISRLKELLEELDTITNEVKELKKFSSINYTGFLKIVKKHDRKRGDRYKVRPMMQLSLAQRPFNSEQGYSPLLNKLSLMYFAIRQHLDGEDAADQAPLELDSQDETYKGEKYTALKCTCATILVCRLAKLILCEIAVWVHPDNLLEVKTLILRHLPSLVYADQSARELDGDDSPAVTSLYFDTKNFELYSGKVERKTEASSLRLRWYGQLSARPEIFVEQKTVDAKGNSTEAKFNIKDKWVKPLLDGEYAMERSVQKMERQGQPAEQINSFKDTVTKIRDMVQQKKLSPVLRAVYVRTAFQKPTDDRVRISIDTDLALIREDTLDSNRPCRDPNEWHRTDIDNSNMTYPFKNINQSEISKFPYAVLEIKLKNDVSRKRPTWVEDLTSSYLLHPVPRFSKFVHGVASLFEDHVNNLPFWLSDLETDIRKDPQKAFEEEEQRRAQRADDAQAVGSLIGAKSSSYIAAQSSPMGKSYLADRMATDANRQSLQSIASRGRESLDVGESSSSGAAGASEQEAAGYGTLSSIIPSFSLSKYSKAKRERQRQAKLPEGVVKPESWIKNAGEVKVEPKVWLANERTFLKWQHICILQGSLALALYSAAGKNLIAEIVGVIYIAIAAFAGVWGYTMMQTRRTMILERSGKDFDNMIGPIVISVAMLVALLLNFFFQVRCSPMAGDVLACMSMSISVSVLTPSATVSSGV